MRFDLVGYRQKDANVYDDVTMPSMTGQPYIESIAYVDKHPQVRLTPAFTRAFIDGKTLIRLLLL